MEAVLSHYGIRLRRVSPHTLRGKCPLPSHSSKEAQSFLVDPAKNVWACHSDSCASARGGKRGGNSLDFVTAMEKCSLREAALKITSWFGAPAGSSPRRSEERHAPQESQATECNAPLRFTLRGVDASHVYLQQRGVSAETAAAFGVGFYGERGIMQGRVVIPVHDGEGKLVAYAGRAIDNAEPKYRFPTGFRKSLELFNQHRATATGRRSVVVVEGFFDCLTVHQAGVPNVVALMGSTMSATQERALTSRFDQIVLMLDGDKPGREATEKIMSQLAGKSAVRVVSIPEGKQPDQLSRAEIHLLMGIDETRPRLPDDAGAGKRANPRTLERTK